MQLYHGTTEKRAISIFNDGYLDNFAKRFYVKNFNGRTATTDGFVYFSNEILYALNYAYNNCTSDNSENIYIFKIDIPIEKIVADQDEIELMDQMKTTEDLYGTLLERSLYEYKTCCVKEKILIDDFEYQYTVINKNSLNNIAELFKSKARNYKYTTENYSKIQKDFIENLLWKTKNDF